MEKYQPTIGLEIHIELKTKSKMFCGCAVPKFGVEPNSSVCPICLGMPGTLPVPNKKAIEQVITLGLALGAEIPPVSKFDRKHYFYPDLPKGYQISQYDQPLTSGGWLKIKSEIRNPKQRKIKIRRIHLEEDTGKLIHPKGADYSLVDYNRAGVPLAELVTEPEITSAVEAKKFCEELQLVLRYLGISNADMEKGEMRCEANISIIQNSKFKIQNDKSKFKKNKTKKLGTKVEIKNLNSFRAVERAINYEIKRQAEVLESGGKITQETRGWNENKGETFSQRSKEKAHDYRYFPEPDIPPLSLYCHSVQMRSNLIRNPDKKNLNSRWSLPRTGLRGGNDKKKTRNAIVEIDVNEIKRSIPELPQEKIERFTKIYNLPEKDIDLLVINRERAERFEEIAKKAKNPKLISDWLIHRGAWSLDKNDILALESKIEKGDISSNQAEEIIKKAKEGGNGIKQIIRKEGIRQIVDKAELSKIIRDVILKNAGVVEKIKKGKTAAKGFLVGEVMRATKGRADPEVVGEMIEEELNF